MILPSHIINSSDTIKTIFAGLFSGILYAVPVGPVATICVQRTLNRGFRSGVANILGIALADLFYISIAAFGFSILRNYINEYFNLLLIISLSIFVVFGLSFIFNNRESTVYPSENVTNKRLIKDFFSIFLISLSNPAGFFFFINLIPIILIKTNLYTQNNLLMLVCSIFAGIIGWWLIAVFLINKWRSKIQPSTIISLRKPLGIIIITLVIITLTVTIVKH